MATIRDVAAHANVSTSTVSHVLNDTRFVEPATKARVLHAIDVIGYRPNSLARSLRRRGTSTIGLLIPDNSNPFFADIARAIEDVSFDAGYNVIFCNSDMSEAKETAYIDVLLSRQVDGLILISTSDRPEQLQPILKARVPVVVVDRELGDAQVDQIVVDNDYGGYLAGQYLARLGHRQIACITGQSDLTPSANRLIGFRRALDEAGIALSPDAIVAGDFRHESGERAVQHLLEQQVAFTALFATNDLMAFGALNALRRAQRNVPDDVSVIGFDNIWPSAIMAPALTTIAQPISEIGRCSAKRVIERIRQPAAAAERMVLAPTLIERDSCRARKEQHT